MTQLIENKRPLRALIATLLPFCRSECLNSNRSCRRLEFGVTPCKQTAASVSNRRKSAIYFFPQNTLPVPVENAFLIDRGRRLEIELTPVESMRSFFLIVAEMRIVLFAFRAEKQEFGRAQARGAISGCAILGGGARQASRSARRNARVETRKQMAQTILITGASSGIGRATAQLFAERGWNVAATMRSPDQGGEWAQREAILCLRLDVTHPESIRKAIAGAFERFGAIEAVVNNAGYGLVGPFEASTPEQIDRQIATNLTGVMNVVREILPHFRKQGRGTIVNVSSVGGRVTFPLYSAYHATKWGLEGFSEGLQFELRPQNIRVKIIEPGPIKTDFYDRSMDVISKPGLTAYDSFVARAMPNLQKAGATAPGPEVVARVIYKAVTDGSWKLRYPANGALFLALRRLFPESWFRAIVNRAVVR
jgi:NAD(P)-dependent dehydrogenase (short-subunit alcohol dehydrogenase family)